MRPTVVKTSQPNEFLALVPELVGFQPENSVALVAFRGNRTCGALRFTLPDPAAPEAVHKRIATTIVGMACKIPGVDALVPVVYTDDEFGAGAREGDDGMPWRSFMRTLTRRCQLSGFLVRDAFCVGRDGWGSYDDPACPAEGRPLAELAASSPGGNGERPASRLGSLSSWADLPDATPSNRRDTAEALRRLRRRGGDAGSRQPALVDVDGGILDPVAVAEDLLAWDPAALRTQDAATVLFLVQSPANRDQMMLQLAFGAEVGAQAFEVNVRYSVIQRATGLSMDDIVRTEMEQAANDGETQSTIAQLVSDLMMGLTTERPDPERIETALRVLKAAAALAPRQARPPVLCMLAWLSWALGRGSVAGIFIDQALQIDPAYGMATLLDTLFGTGHLPEWAYAVPAS